MIKLMKLSVVFINSVNLSIIRALRDGYARCAKSKENFASGMLS